MTTVLISGGSGLIGSHLCQKLSESGYNVAILSRSGNQNTAFPSFVWNPEKHEIDIEATANTDYIIHLAGLGIGEKKWTKDRKQRIIDSRVNSAQLIYDNIKVNNHNIKAFITASAIGYYGSVSCETIFTETDPPANDFQGDCCRKWEEAADLFKASDIRTVKIRTGVVLTKKGGALAKMIIPIKMGIGSALGNGKQYMPWIHIDDLCGIYIKAIEDAELKGAYNGVAPEHITNDAFTFTLAKFLKRPYFFPNIPAFILKLIFGDLSEIFLKGSRISSAKITKSGYHFCYPDLENALKDVCDR